FRAVHLPGLAVVLARHIGERIEAVFRFKYDFVNRFVSSTAAILVKNSSHVEIAVWRRVKLGVIALQRMGGELFDVDGHWRCQALRTEHVETHRRAIFIGANWQAV